MSSNTNTELVMIGTGETSHDGEDLFYIFDTCGRPDRADWELVAPRVRRFYAELFVAAVNGAQQRKAA